MALHDGAIVKQIIQREGTFDVRNNAKEMDNRCCTFFSETWASHALLHSPTLAGRSREAPSVLHDGPVAIPPIHDGGDLRRSCELHRRSTGARKVLVKLLFIWGYYFALTLASIALRRADTTGIINCREETYGVWLTILSLWVVRTQNTYIS